MHDAVKYFFDNMAAQLDSSELRYDESLVTNAWVVADNVRIVNYAVVIDAQTQCDVDLGFGHRACETDPTVRSDYSAVLAIELCMFVLGEVVDVASSATKVSRTSLVNH